MTTNEFLNLAMVSEGMAAGVAQREKVKLAAEKAALEPVAVTKDEGAAPAEMGAAKAEVAGSAAVASAKEEADSNAVAVAKEEEVARVARSLTRAEEAALAEAAVKRVDEVLKAGPVAKPGKELRLGDLSFEQRWALVIGSKGLKMKELAERLVGYGYKASEPTVSRFIKRVKEERAIEEGQEMGEAARRVAANGNGAALRAGSLDVMRQQLFERAVNCTRMDERMQMYEALVREEERIKKLALEEEKVRLQERGLDLQAERLRLEASRGGKVLLELAEILASQKLEDAVKVAQAMQRLKSWREGAIEVRSEVKRLEEVAGGKGAD